MCVNSRLSRLVIYITTNYGFDGLGFIRTPSIVIFFFGCHMIAVRCFQQTHLSKKFPHFYFRTETSLFWNAVFSSENWTNSLVILNQAPSVYVLPLIERSRYSKTCTGDSFSFTDCLMQIPSGATKLRPVCIPALRAEPFQMGREWSNAPLRQGAISITRSPGWATLVLLQQKSSTGRICRYPLCEKHPFPKTIVPLAPQKLLSNCQTL